MKHLVNLLFIAITTGALPSLGAQDADALQAPAAKVFTERQDCTVTLTVTLTVIGA